MKILFITRATFLESFGGDSVQLQSTVKYLREMGVEVDVKLCNEKINYSKYDLIHLFNIIRPADSLIHIRKSGKPYVISTIYLDYETYEKSHRKGLLKWMNLLFSKSAIEYMKALARYLKNGEKINSPEYLWLGHKGAMKKLAKRASLLLPNSQSEYKRLEEHLGFSKSYQVVHNGIDHRQHSKLPVTTPKEKDLVICVARIEGNKNQLKLIEALNNTEFRLKIIGKPAPNHLKYHEKCKRIAAPNVEFMGFIELDELVQNFQKAKVHILPSYSETCGLSSLEAAYHKCSLVITKGGDTQEYFQENATYCEPDDATSILQAVRVAARSNYSKRLRQKIIDVYSWENAAIQTMNAYREVLGDPKAEHREEMNQKTCVSA